MNVFLLHLRNINLIVNVLYFTFVFLISLTVPEKKKKKGGLVERFGRCLQFRYLLL